MTFHAAGGGVGPMTWGQREIWREMRFTGVPLNLGAAFPAPPDTTVDDMVAMLRFLVRRYPSLRTRFQVDADGQPCRQVLSDAGEIPLEIVDAADDPAGVAEQLRQRYRVTPFDYATEWPLRLAVVRSGGSVTHVVAMYCHLALDAYSLLHVVVPELADIHTTRPHTGMSPLEQARRQATEDARRQSDGALRHWARTLRAVPPDRFGPPPPVTGHRHWDLTYQSPATHLAVGSIAACLRVEPTAVLLAAYAVTLAGVTGRHPVVAQLLVNNRFRPGFADTVSPIAQPGLCVLDVAGIPFRAAVGRARRASLVASMNAYYDPDERDRLVATINRERGVDIDLSSFVNHRARPAADPPGSPAMASCGTRWAGACWRGTRRRSSGTSGCS